MEADLNSMKVDELKVLAKAAGIHGWAQMKKADLISALDNPIESAKASQPKVEAPVGKTEKSSHQDIDYAKHPKFHKFNCKAKGAE